MQHYFDEGKSGVAVPAECMSIARGVGWVVSWSFIILIFQADIPWLSFWVLARPTLCSRLPPAKPQALGPSFICILFRLHWGLMKLALAFPPQPHRCVGLSGMLSQMLTNAWQLDREEEQKVGWHLQVWPLIHLESSVAPLKLQGKWWGPPSPSLLLPPPPPHPYVHSLAFHLLVC